MTVLQSLQACGGDAERTLARFSGNVALLTRFVLKFPQDPTYQSLSEAVSKGDLPQVEIMAHTLKGTAGNLGYQVLSDRSAALVDAVRRGAADEVPGLYEQVTKEYQRAVDSIGQVE